MDQLPCHTPGDEGPLAVARLQLARQVVWAWHLGVVVSAVELDFADPGASFVDYGELWDDHSWQQAMWTASLCAADSPHSPGPGSVESETVQELLALAAALDGSLLELDPQRLEQAELELRATIDHQLELPGPGFAVARVARALTRSSVLDAGDVVRMLGPCLPLGAGKAGFVRVPSAARAE